MQGPRLVTVRVAKAIYSRLPFTYAGNIIQQPANQPRGAQILPNVVIPNAAQVIRLSQVFVPICP